MTPERANALEEAVREGMRVANELSDAAATLRREVARGVAVHCTLDAKAARADALQVASDEIRAALSGVAERECA